MFDTGFPCSINPDAKLLIMGSMPGRRSLHAQQYYAHPQNAFWPIMAELFGFDACAGYEERLRILRQNSVALWDVAHQCVRPGSLDSAIDMQTVVANNFNALYASHPKIRTLFFNGRKAHELYRKLVEPELNEKFRTLEKHLLPSTSPANAALPRSEKLEAWRIILNPLETG